MHSPVFIALGLGFVIMGVALFALTMGKSPPPPTHPTKAQLREQTARALETKKMRIAAGVVTGFGILLALIFFS